MPALPASTLDVAIIGGGAAGLATGIFAGRSRPGARIAVLEGARTPGAKILVSGGGRCNVTNVRVTPADFNGGRPGTIRRVLGALPTADTIAFFGDLGVSLHEEERGKLFPDSNRARQVLDALLAALRDVGADLRLGHRVERVSRSDDGFTLSTSQGELQARSVVIATGGLALPKSGSDGAGYALARHFGHSLVATTPALVPLVFEQTRQASAPRGPSGVAHPVRLMLRVNGKVTRTIDGPMLWTHFGISGPAALDVSRHWLRARLAGDAVSLEASVCPADTNESLETWWLERTREQPKMTVAKALADKLPASVALAVADHADVAALSLAQLSRDRRRSLTRALLACALPASDSRGYTYAEVTAGGVPLTEIDPASMESRLVPNLYLVGEVLDVDGRLGGFNFQWAWASGAAAGRACVSDRISTGQSAQPSV